MKSTALVCALAAAALGVSSVSQAHGVDRDGPRGEPSRLEQRAPANPAHSPWPDGAQVSRQPVAAAPAPWPGPARVAPQHDWRHDGPRDWHGGSGHRAQGPHFHRGGYLPPQYRGGHHVVHDWRGHHLTPPPRGQQWVQVGTDVLLVAVATGLIAQVILNH